MTNTNTTHQHSFEDIARRTAFSFLLFSAVLAGLLTLSWYVLVPELTHTEVGGTVRSMRELKSYKADLEAQILTLEEERGSFLLPVDNNLYNRLKSMKESRVMFQGFRQDLKRIIKDLVPDQAGIVHLDLFAFYATQNAVEIRGDVRNVGPRSMTVLAQFVEDIQELDSVLSVETNRYTRKQSEGIGFHSPFVLRVHLQ